MSWRAHSPQPPSLLSERAHEAAHCSSRAVGSGAHVTAVLRMLGHTSAATTLDSYADPREDDLDD